MVSLQRRTSTQVGLVVNVVPGDDIGEPGGGRGSYGEDEPALKCSRQELEYPLTLLTGRKKSPSGRAGVTFARVLMFRLWCPKEIFR